MTSEFGAELEGFTRYFRFAFVRFSEVDCCGTASGTVDEDMSAREGGARDPKRFGRTEFLLVERSRIVPGSAVLKQVRCRQSPGV